MQPEKLEPDISPDNAQSELLNFSEFGPRPDWMLKGGCRKSPDPEAFFSGGDQKLRIVKALRYCGGCAVKELCLNYALDKPEEYGIWGGKTQKQLTKIRNSRLAEKNKA